MHIYRSQSALNIPFGPGITRTYSKPSFATYMCSGGHWPSTTPCWPYAFSYYYPLSSSYFYYYKPWRLNYNAYRYYRTLADSNWEERFHYYTPPQRFDRNYLKNWEYPEDRHKPLYMNYCES
uniref:Uncharacterized protein n=1 Tax=Meloidogyne enterolobii TaxID=390850 RepID=A0A6V7WAX2_MELEN|nr:unnamed protein product [Meloidogyne enterolobii]